MKKLHAVPVFHENTRVPVPTWGSVPGAKSPVYQSARFCSPKVHAISLHLSFTPEPKPNSGVLGENRSYINIYSGPLPFLPTPGFHLSSHKTEPALLIHGKDLCRSPASAPRQCPVHLISNPACKTCVIKARAPPPLWSGSRTVTSTQKLYPLVGGHGAVTTPSPRSTCALRFLVVVSLFLVRECYYSYRSIRDASKMSFLYRKLQRDVD